jgi:3-hydroxy-9,10-secoandrosta-1,3,5(10)-triene-9,17-dione monooxygenase
MGQSAAQLNESTNGERLIAATRSFVPIIRERARAMETARRLDDEIVAAMDNAGIFAALVPKRFGGAGLEPHEVNQIAEILGSADCSTAWVTAFYIFHNWLLCRFPKHVQEELYRDRSSVCCAAVWNPPGYADKVKGGHRVTGRWAYATGIHHAPYCLVPAKIRNSVYWFIVPKEQLQLSDDWDMRSMVATGSVTVAAANAFVADEWGMEISALVSATDHHGTSHPESVYRYPFNALTLATTSIAVGALDRAVELCRGKLETSHPMGVARIDRAAARVRWTKAFQAARVAHYVRDAANDEKIARYARGEPNTLQIEAMNGLNGMTVSSIVMKAMRLLLDGFGTSGYQANDQLCRSAGDIAMMATHGLGGDYDVFIDRHSRWVLGLGLGPGDPKTRL